MLCPNCQASLKEEELYCHECGYKVAVHEQQEKVDQAQANIKKSILSTFKSPLVKILGIAMTFMTVLGIVSPISFIFILISTVGIWKCVSSREKDDFFSALNLTSMYDGYMRVTYLISMILYIIIDVIAICLIFVQGEPLAALFQVISCVLSVVIMNLIMKFHDKRRAFMMEVYNVSSGSRYVYIKAPAVSSCIWGSFIVLVSAVLFLLFGSHLLVGVDSLMNGALDMVGLDSIGELDDLELLICVVIVWTSALSFLNGLFLLLSGIWMGQLSNRMYHSNETLEKENALLDEVEKNTKLAMMEDRRKKKEQEDKERKAREEEERRIRQEQEEAQQRQQEKKQELMEMMILQMLRSNGANVDNMEDAVAAFAAELAAKNTFDVQSASTKTPNTDTYTPTDDI